MKIALDQPIEVSFDSENIAKASKIMDEIRVQHYAKDIPLVLDSLFVLLTFYQLERQSPGTFLKFQEAVQSACDAPADKGTASC